MGNGGSAEPSTQREARARQLEQSLLARCARQSDVPRVVLVTSPLLDSRVLAQALIDGSPAFTRSSGMYAAHFLADRPNAATAEGAPVDELMYQAMAWTRQPGYGSAQLHEALRARQCENYAARIEQLGARVGVCNPGLVVQTHEQYVCACTVRAADLRRVAEAQMVAAANDNDERDDDDLVAQRPRRGCGMNRHRPLAEALPRSGPADGPMPRLPRHSVARRHAACHNTNLRHTRQIEVFCTAADADAAALSAGALGAAETCMQLGSLEAAEMLLEHTAFGGPAQTLWVFVSLAAPYQRVARLFAMEHLARGSTEHVTNDTLRTLHGALAAMDQRFEQYVVGAVRRAHRPEGDGQYCNTLWVQFADEPLARMLDQSDCATPSRLTLGWFLQKHGAALADCITLRLLEMLHTPQIPVRHAELYRAAFNLSCTAGAVVEGRNVVVTVSDHDKMLERVTRPRMPTRADAEAYASIMSGETARDETDTLFRRAFGVGTLDDSCLHYVLGTGTTPPIRPKIRASAQELTRAISAEFRRTNSGRPDLFPPDNE